MLTSNEPLTFEQWRALQRMKAARSGWQPLYDRRDRRFKRHRDRDIASWELVGFIKTQTRP